MLNNEGTSESQPIVARVGCLDKVDKSIILGGNFIHAAESKKSILNDFDKLLRSNSDPELRALMESTAASENFIDNQKSRLDAADVIGVTCASTNSTLLTSTKCDVLILDEVSQMTEALTLLPIACAKPKKLLLVGDPLQLPPAVSVTVSASQSASSTAALFNFSNTIFDRLLNIGYKQFPLRVQYRCHPDIAEICNKLFYGGTLQHGVQAVDRPAKFPNLVPVVFFNNTSDEAKVGDSCANRGEAMTVLNLLLYLQGIEPEASAVSYGVICMYKAQAFEINKLMSESSRYKSIRNAVISTVDAFQGHEMDVIIICTSRNAVSDFLSNANRVNVAISRAKFHLLVVGNVEALKLCPLWGNIIDSCDRILNSMQDLCEICARPT
jgi:superfamily I DNA and/or RNA helicase